MARYIEKPPTSYARASNWVRLNLAEIQRKRYCQAEFLATPDGRILSDNEICVGTWEVDDRDNLIIDIEEYR